MSTSIKDFLKSQDYTRKFRPQLKKKYTLIFGDAVPAKNTDKPSMQVGVRNKATGEAYAWITSSKSALDKVADLEKGDIFHLTQSIKVIGGTPMKIYDIEITEGKDEETEELEAEEPTDIAVPEDI